MSQTHTLTATAVIAAPAARIYALLADYRQGHPRILPKHYFEWLEVEEGGIGAGTIIRFRMNLSGQRLTFRAAITEPNPGRVLHEQILGGKSETIFTVTPQSETQAEVTITTQTQVRDGWLGKLEGWFTTRMLRPVYQEELRLLAQVMGEGG